ncbi:MAG: Gfo/Idh/MocA family oxidoreductase [Armatimonadetes bacterium]|nr:Gfo/Idh/MocA family oxidoreductase [Armatimonadota bacterium]MDW8123122.1 Gfo/Idh/MocA family oxidoreductase [Armatimonadota bacterium]
MERVRVGVVGTGSIFRGAHLPAYPEIEEAQVVALCDNDPRSLGAAARAMADLYERTAQRLEERGEKERAETLRKDAQKVTLYRDYREMLKKEKPDLVEICTSPDAHAPIAIESLKAGSNVMCEKPMSRTWLECLDICQAVEETGKFYQHNENWLYDPFYYTVRKFLDAGAIGEVVALYLNTAHPGPENRLFFWDEKLAGGGSLLDNGIHAVTASWFLAGFDTRPVTVKAAAPIGIAQRMPLRIIDGRFRPFRVEDDGHILILFQEPTTGRWATAHVEGSWSHPDSPPTAIYGTMGMIRPTYEDGRLHLEITDSFGRIRKVEASGPTWTFWPSSFYGEIKNMVQCVLSGVKPICDHQVGAESQAIVGAAYLSQARGQKAVSLEEYKEFALAIRKKAGKRANEVLIEEQLKALHKTVTD